MRLFYFFLLVLMINPTIGTHHLFGSDNSFDVKKYIIQLELDERSNTIKAKTELIIDLSENPDKITLDFASGPEIRGLIIESVIQNGQNTEYSHRDNKLQITVNQSDNNCASFEITYHGEFYQGIRISENIHGDRAFFTNNSLQNSHKWFPCLDHPSERAAVDFIITAPSHYMVVANGLLNKRVSLPGRKVTHHWSSDIPVPVKSFGFAAGSFAVEYPGCQNMVQLSNWLYPQDFDNSVTVFSTTSDIIDFLTGILGPYPFEKLSNVQSTVSSKGVKGAGIIFYDERDIRGDLSIERDIVKSIAMQWFGNHLSVSDWPHIWISEGISTWLANKYIEQRYGSERLHELLRADRESIIDYSSIRLAPVIDPHSDNLEELLNPNSGIKAAWILHMLDQKIGRDSLINGIVEFYKRYKLSHAGSDDFFKVIEEVAGMNLSEFSDDWLYSAGHPVIATNTRYNDGLLVMEISQMQQHKMAFTFPVEIKFVLENRRDIAYAFDIRFRKHEFVLEMPEEPVDIVIDPNYKLLFESR